MLDLSRSSASLERHRAAVRARLDGSGLLRPGPGSVSWKVNREALVVAGWGRAILLLLAHPSIAAAVDEHSSFRLSLPARAGRLRSTVRAMQALTFGSREEAISAAASINAIHDRVNGRTTSGTYSAHDPHLLRWVHATLIESILLTYELLVGALTAEERDAYCAEAAIMEPLLGMPAGWLPRDSASLDAYVRGMHAGGSLIVYDTSRTLARAVLFPPMWRALWPVFRALQMLTLGTLPPGIRAAYGLEWGARDGKALARWVRGLRWARRLLPPVARQWAPARRISNRRALITQRMTAHMRTHLILLVGLTAMLGDSPAHAQDKIADVDKIFSWVAPGTPGCAVAAAQHGKVVVNRAYGLADLERDVPITPASVFDAASIVKQFVAVATLLLAEDGKLSLADDVRKHVPELPDYGHTITLDHLLTHTSGLRDWDGLMPLSNGKADALTLTLRQRGLNFAPGEEWSYSNSGYVLLKEIVARTSGLSFAEFTRTRLFEPLGMTSTQYLDDMRDVVRNRALAYDKAGNRWRLDMQMGNDRGGGGALLSTAGDLILWNEVLTNARLGAAISEKLQEPARLSNGRKLGYARGLHLDINRAGNVIWHTGGSAGYRSVLARFPESGLSVAIMCNSGEGADSRTAFVRRIFDIFVPASATVNAEPEASTARVEG
ncbi:MAG: serine hydrolase, partial [Acidobacteria bacterium]|nr:serine hydrolase [Acidobacteriota bacterium]